MSEKIEISVESLNKLIGTLESLNATIEELKEDNRQTKEILKRQTMPLGLMPEYAQEVFNAILRTMRAEVNHFLENPDIAKNEMSMFFGSKGDEFSEERSMDFINGLSYFGNDKVYCAHLKSLGVEFTIKEAKEGVQFDIDDMLRQINYCAWATLAPLTKEGKGKFITFYEDYQLDPKSSDVFGDSVRGLISRLVRMTHIIKGTKWHMWNLPARIERIFEYAEEGKDLSYINDKDLMVIGRADDWSVIDPRNSINVEVTNFPSSLYGK